MGVLLLFAMGVAIYFFLIKKWRKSKAIPKIRREKSNHLSMDDEFNSNKIDNKKEVDRLLEKVSKRGVKSLTKKEKEFLDEQSKK